MSLKKIIQANALAVASDSANARVTFTARGRAADGVATAIEAGSHSFLIDEPAALGGHDQAANPVEVALASLIACQVVTYRFWAAHLDITLDDIDVRAEGDLDVRGFFGLDEHTRAGFTDVRLSVELSGPEGPSRYAELRAAVDAHCPVLDLFGNPTPVSVTVRVPAAV